MMKFRKHFLFLFSFLFKIPAILSQQENIKQKCLSFFFFLFFLLSVSLTWVKVSKTPDWSVWQCSFNKFNYWRNRTFTVPLSLFFNTYNFPIFKNCRRKTVWVVRIFDGFLIFRFLSLLFIGECLFWSKLNSAIWF